MSYRDLTSLPSTRVSVAVGFLSSLCWVWRGRCPPCPLQSIVTPRLGGRTESGKKVRRVTMAGESLRHARRFSPVFSQSIARYRATREHSVRYALPCMTQSDILKSRHCKREPYFGHVFRFTRDSGPTAAFRDEGRGYRIAAIGCESR